MTDYNVHDGTVTIAGVAVGQITGGRLTVDRAISESSYWGLVWAKNSGGVRRWSGAFDYRVDYADPGQEDITDQMMGASPGDVAVSLILRLTDGKALQGDALLSGIEVTGGGEGYFEGSTPFVGTDALNLWWS